MPFSFSLCLVSCMSCSIISTSVIALGPQLFLPPAPDIVVGCKIHFHPLVVVIRISTPEVGKRRRLCLTRPRKYKEKEKMTEKVRKESEYEK